MFNKRVFVAQIRNFYKACDLVHLCVVLGSELLHLRLNMMNTIYLSEKGSIFRKFWATRHGELHHSPRRVIVTNPEIHQQLAITSKSAREASCIRTCNVLSEINALSLIMLMFPSRTIV